MKTVVVAVGVIKNSSGEVCVTKRPAGKHLAGLWEFPGGKVEKGESTYDALKRELEEELAIEIQGSEPLITVDFAYPEKKVHLDVHVVDKFAGTALGREGQDLMWVKPHDLATLKFPEANAPIIQAILGY